nr:immunoglobulin heavy chain junction region [Mus musculus]
CARSSYYYGSSHFDYW